MIKSDSKVLCWLFIASCISIAVAKDKFFGFDESTKEECMEEHSLTEGDISIIKQADQPIESYSCFFGCMMYKEGTINETGQLNQTNIEASVNEMENEEEKAIILSVLKDLGDDLAQATCTCSAGTIVQTYIYSLKAKTEN